jgi:ABC-type polysaccharide/polyol phosphate export permease
MEFNPFYYVVESSRLAVFGGLTDAWWNLGILAIVAVVSLAVGGLVFRTLQPGFADVV